MAGISSFMLPMLPAWLLRISFCRLLATASLSFRISSKFLSPGRSGMGMLQCRDSSQDSNDILISCEKRVWEIC